MLLDEEIDAVNDQPADIEAWRRKVRAVDASLRELQARANERAGKRAAGAKKSRPGRLAAPPAPLQEAPRPVPP